MTPHEHAAVSALVDALPSCADGRCAQPATVESGGLNWCARHASPRYQPERAAAATPLPWGAALPAVRVLLTQQVRSETGHCIAAALCDEKVAGRDGLCAVHRNRFDRQAGRMAGTLAAGSVRACEACGATGAGVARAEDGHPIYLCGEHLAERR